MNVEELRNFCLNLEGVEETFPFDEVTLVFKVAGKMFCLTSLDATQLSINVKCDPDTAIELRERYTGVLPGYHMSKKHWNTLAFDGSFDDAQARQWILDSYALVKAGLTKKERELLG